MRVYSSLVLLFALTACGPARSEILWQGAAPTPQEQPGAFDQPRTSDWYEHPKFSVQGHRGARAIYPENTLPAFDYALSVGVNQIELDIHISKDGVPIILHDPKVSDRVCVERDGSKIKKPKAVLDLTVAELKQFDCGSVQKKGRPKHNVPGAKIPTFQEVIDLVLQSQYRAAQNVIFKVDIKSTNDRALYPTQERIAELVLKATHENGINNRSIYSSFDRGLLAALRTQDPKARLALLEEGPLSKKLLKEAAELQVETVSPFYLMLTLQGPKKWTRRIQDAGFRVVPWTVNKQKSWKKLIEAGVDGIITDDPEGLIAFYEGHKDSGGALAPTPEELAEEIELTPQQVQDLLIHP